MNALKQELVERSLEPGASVAAIAQEHGINANLLFNWRRLRLGAQEPGSVIRPVIDASTKSVGEMPAVSGPDDWLALNTRLRVVLEDPRQLLSGCVTGFWLPARTPPQIVDRFNREIRAITRPPQMMKFISDAGLEPMNTTPAETAAIIQREAASMGRLIKAKGIKID